MRRLVIALVLALILQGFVFAANPESTIGSDVPYLHVMGGVEADFFQFNEKGVYIPQTEPPVELKAGWIVLSGQEPVTVSAPFGKIVLQRESILAIGSLDEKEPALYLVAGSANVLAYPSFAGEMNLSTPVAIYKFRGPGEVFITSDLSELVYALSGKVIALNTITRQRVEIQPYTYLNMADPFILEKPISRQTYETLSIDPNPRVASRLPSVDIQLTPAYQAPAPVAAPQAEPVVAPVAAPPAEPVVAPVAAPPAEPVVAPVAAPQAEPVVAPVAAPPAEPVVAPVAAPPAEPVVAPVAAPPAEPVVAPVATPPAEPVVAPVAAPPAEPVVAPVEAPAPPPKTIPTVPKVPESPPIVSAPRVTTITPTATPKPIVVPTPEPVVETEPVAELVVEPVAAEEVEPVVQAEAVLEPVADPVAAEPAVAVAAERKGPTADMVVKAEDASTEFDLYIVHTNDVMGRIDGTEGIGYAKLATLLDWGRDLTDKHLLLDAGNVTSGTALADAFQGESAAVLLDALGYDAVAPGPADFVYGADRLLEAARIADEQSDLKVLSANVLNARGEWVFQPYQLYYYNDFVVAVAGLTAPALISEGLSFVSQDVIDSAQYAVDYIREQADYVVLLGSIGNVDGITSEVIAQNVKGIDLIIDGKGANAPAGGKQVGDTLIVNAGEYLSSVGLVQLQVRNGEVVATYANRITAAEVNDPSISPLAKAYGVSTVPSDSETQAIIDYYAAELAQITPTVEPPVVELASKVEPTPVTTEPPVVTISPVVAPVAEPVVEPEPVEVEAPVVTITSESPTEPVEIKPAVITIGAQPEKVETPVIATEAETEEPIAAEPVETTIAAETEIAEITEETPAETEAPKTTADALTIQKPLGITASPVTETVKRTYYGFSTSFNTSKSNLLGASDAKVGISINPFFSHDAFFMGLQAYFLTDGDLFSASTWDHTNLNLDTASALRIIRSALQFIDFMRYGVEGDPFYLNIDDHTPISFGKNVLVNNLGTATGPYEQKLGVYSSGGSGWWGYEVFLDDLYLNNLISNSSQFGGGRFIITPSPEGYALSIGLSSLFKLNTSQNSLIAYPTFDMTFPIMNERRLRAQAYFSITTALNTLPFDFSTVFDSSGVGFAAKLPNYLLAAGIDLQTPQWDIRFIGSYQKTTDGFMSTGMLNPTLYSGTHMLENANPYFMVAAEVGYSTDRFGARGSYQLPIIRDFSGLVPLETDATTKGDIAAVGISYESDAFEFNMGIRRIGFIDSFSSIFDLSGGLSGFLSNALNFVIDGQNSQPYLSLDYQAGLFAIRTQLLVASGGTRLDIGATVTVGDRTLAEAKELDPDSVAWPVQRETTEGMNVSVDMNTFYAKTLGSINDNHLFLQPVVTLTNERFSLGLGPRINLDLNSSLSPAQWYTHDDSQWYSFGSDYPGTIGKLYDITTDLFSLIDHVRIGNEESAFKLDLNHNQNVNSGVLVNNLSTSAEAPFGNKLGLMASLDTKVVDSQLFMDDMTDPQLGGIRMDITPFKTWNGKLGLSLIGNAILSDATKRVDLFPSIDLDLPVLANETLSMGLKGSVSTLLGYSFPTTFKQMLITDNGSSFFTNLDNYLFTGTVALTTGAFSVDLTAAMQKGALSYGMFNEMLMRNRVFLLDESNTAWLGNTGKARTWLGAVDFSWQNEDISTKASYQLPISADFSSLQFNEDLLKLSGSWNASFGDISLGYTRKGFATAARNVLTGSTSIYDFLFDGRSMLSTTASFNQGPLQFTASIAAIARYREDDDGTWNGSQPLPITATTLADVQVIPSLSLGVKISIFE